MTLTGLVYQNGLEKGKFEAKEETRLRNWKGWRKPVSRLFLHRHLRNNNAGVRLW